jgi:hypothetical protein
MPESSLQPSELLSLWQTVVQWRDSYRVTCPESVYQRDDVNESLSELADKLLSIVGYPEEETSPLVAQSPVNLVPQNPVSLQANLQELRITRLRNTLDYITRGPPHGDARDWAQRALAEDDRLRDPR